MEVLALVLFGIIFILLLKGYPVAITLGGVSVLFFLGVQLFEPEYFSAINFYIISYRFMGIMKNYVLMAVPLFIFMGIMLQKSGLADSLLETMGLLLGHLRGGLAISVIIVGALLAASTGIVGATVVTMGLISLPTMLRNGYSPEVATGTIASAGTLGQIIPPSIVLILLADTISNSPNIKSGVDVGSMFKAALIPGFILVGIYILYIIILGQVNKSLVPKVSKEELEAFRGEGFAMRVLKAFLLPMTLIILVLGSIFAGIASPTEAAAVGALGAIILTVIQGKFSMDILKEVMQQTTWLTSMVFLILLGATTFTMVFKLLGGDEYLINLILSANLSANAFLFIVMLVIFIAGFFIDFIEIIFIIVPVVTPIFDQLGVDLLWVGILIALNLQTSFITPPFGFSLFYLKGVAPPEVRTSHIYRGIVPYIIIQLCFLGLVIFFPDIIKMWS
ncbi:MAG: TRAP transporter large permease subunit [Bacteroidota bacterium]